MPAPARVYDAWLSGKDNLAADRDAAGSVTALLPSIIETVRENRAFARRAVCYLAGWQGISQFIDIGCGLPAAPAARETAVHDIAQRITPDARVLYCDNDPEVMAHARALWTSSHDGLVSYLEADVRDPGYILAQAAQVIDLSYPVAVMLCAVLHFVGDRDDPAGIVARLASGLAPGSCIVLSHAAGDIDPGAAHAAAAAYNERVPVPITLRSFTQVTALLGGVRGTLVSPGVTPVAAWRRGEHDPPACRSDAYGAAVRLRRAGGRH
jgi:SAM-dependent methyltransferase